MPSKKPVIAVVGGAGYIGSHTAKLLFEKGFSPVIIDNFSTGHHDFIQWGTFYTCCLSDQESLTSLLKKINPVAVFHFAASINVSESVIDPELYYHNNVNGTLNLLSSMRKADISNLIFSSTAAVYGHPESNLILESHPCRPINPYGQSKYMMEHIIKDFHEAYGLNYIIFRYFNAAGADHDHLIGEDHSPETHLIPNILMAASGVKPTLTVFGNNYDTPDGTCIRDYIHVSDLALAHVLGLNYLLDAKQSHCMNLGTSQGLSILELIKHAEIITRTSIAYTFYERRSGDPPILVADASFAQSLLDWEPQHSSIDTILNTSWKWFQSRFHV